VANTFRARSTGVLVLLCLLVALAVAGSSQAALLPTAPKAVCSPASQAFLPWQDAAYYGLVPGGSFESSLSGWSLGRGAQVVSGNESAHVNGPNDARSLYLPSGSSVVTAPACFAFADWKLRFFVKSVGPATGTLRVKLVGHGLLGSVFTLLDAGNVTASADGSWQPSAPIGIGVLAQLGSLLTTNSVSVQLTAVGGSFQVDDVYLDPWYSY
jgi:hypothetical protein